MTSIPFVCTSTSVRRLVLLFSYSWLYTTVSSQGFYGSLPHYAYGGDPSHDAGYPGVATGGSPYHTGLYPGYANQYQPGYSVGSPSPYHQASPYASVPQQQHLRQTLPGAYHGSNPYAVNPLSITPQLASTPPLSPPPAFHTPGSTCTASQPPKIDYGDCPQLEPKDEDKMKKEEKQKECLKDLEVSENTTVDALSLPLQNKVKECVLRKDELLNEAGKFNYEKAMEKLKEKSLPEQIDKKIGEAHVECKIQAERKYLSSERILDEFDNYQQCMDFHLAMLCNIKTVNPIPPNTNHFHGIHQLPSQSPSNYHHLTNVPTNYGNVMNRLNILANALRK